MRVLIYGAGQTGEQVLSNIQSELDVIGFLDGNPEKKGRIIRGIPVLGDVEVLKVVEFDRIYIGTIFWRDVRKKLLSAGIAEENIMVDIPHDVDSPVRNTWLECYANLNDAADGSVAECGVYRGDFATVINRYFPHSKLYLFDTFEGNVIKLVA